MRRIVFKFVIFITIFTSFIVVSCNKVDVEKQIADQGTKIENYLTTLNLSSSVIDGVYKARMNQYPSQGMLLDKGDSLYFYYGEYIFTSRPDRLVYTNIEELAIDQKFDTSLMDFNPKGIKYGSGDILGSIENGLRHSQAGDTLMLFLTSDIAYGEKGLSIVDPNTAIAVYLILKDVIKN